MKASVAEKSLDNITVVIIAFKNLRKSLKSEMDKFRVDLKKQKDGILATDNGTNDRSNIIEEQHAAEQIENKRMLGNAAERGNKESGILISKKLNLPNYDVTLNDVEVMQTLVGLARL